MWIMIIKHSVLQIDVKWQVHLMFLCRCFLVMYTVMLFIIYNNFITFGKKMVICNLENLVSGIYLVLSSILR